MPQMTRTEMAMYAACALVIAVLGWRAVERSGGSPAASSTPAHASAVHVSAAPLRSATVHVVGAVRRPGVYRLRMGQRVQDAIRRAGGARSGADLQAINLAAKLTDALQVVVPRKAPVGPSVAAPGAAASSGGAAASSAASTPVNLNSATAEQLDTLDGIGPTTAQKIIEFRTQHGGFTSIDDLGQIPGIGPKRLESLRTQVQL